MKLKYVRIVLSLFVFSLIVLFYFIPKNFLLMQLPKLQFFPLFLRVFYSLSILAIIFLFLLLIMTFIFGRFYCSSLCPIGTLQDIMIFIKKILTKKKFKYQSSYGFLHYTITLASFFGLAAGSILLFNLLDPFSNFGRSLTLIVKPFSVFTANAAAEGVNAVFPYAMSYQKVNFSVSEVSLLTLFLFVFIIVSSFFKGRFFCNTICPVGGFLRVISKYSYFKLTIEKNKCISCGVCEYDCKAGCIDSSNHSIDYSRCIHCYNCLPSCSQNAIGFTSKSTTKLITGEEVDIERRALLKSGLKGLPFVVLGLIVPKVLLTLRKTKKPDYIHPVIIPPGSRGLSSYSEKCISCQSCVTVCPSKVLRPELFAFGLSGIFQPRMDYNKSFCEYDCNLCGQVCPSGAIAPVTVSEKKRISIGRVLLDNKTCLVYSSGQHCGACAEHCPTGAVVTKRYKGNLFGPVTNTDYCIGCGACEYVCPVRPIKAIRVEGLSNHQRAVIKKENTSDPDKQSPKIKDNKNAFPF